MTSPPLPVPEMTLIIPQGRRTARIRVATPEQCDEISRQAVLAKLGMQAAQRAMEPVRPGLDDADGWAGPVTAWQASRDGVLAGLRSRPGYPHGGGRAQVAAQRAMDEQQADEILAGKLFLPREAERLLAEPASPFGGRRGHVRTRAQVMYRQGTSLTADADSPEVIRVLDSGAARLLRTWDVDWTGDQPRVVNEVRFGAEITAVPDAPAIDSEGWTCGGCGGKCIGGRPAGDVCKGCTATMLARSIADGTPLLVIDDDLDHDGSAADDRHWQAMRRGTEDDAAAGDRAQEAEAAGPYVEDEPDEAAVLAAGELAADEVATARDRERRSDSAVSGADVLLAAAGLDAEMREPGDLGRVSASRPAWR